MDTLFSAALRSLSVDDELPAPFAPGPLTGVLFAEDFDGPLVIEATPREEAAPPPELAVPSFSEEDLEAARRDGHAAGLREAREAAAKARLADRVSALERIAAGLTTAGTDAAAAVEAAVEGTATLILQMICRTLPALSAAHGETEIRMLVQSLLPALAREPQVTIRVNPQHLDGLREELQELDPASAARMTLLAAPGMAAGDARIDWEAGSAKREAAAVQSAVEAALAGLGLLAPKTAKPGADGAPQQCKQNAGRELAHVG